MKIERGTKLLIDTNILLEASDEGRDGHLKALRFFEEAPTMGVDLFLATQCLREYLVVATRPVANNGLGMKIEHAIENIARFRSRTSLIAESTQASECFLAWAAKFRTHGKKLHDLQLLATALRGGMHALITLNPNDFPKIRELAVMGLEGKS